MKVVASVLCVAALIACASALVLEDPEVHFNNFVAAYGKTYSSDQELAYRKAVFSKNLNEINAVNSDPTSTWVAGVNEYADLTWEEFQQEVGLMAPQPDCSATNAPRVLGGLFDEVVPKSIDWREKGVITMVKNQKQCGSCWTFSTTGCLEAHHAIKTGVLLSLSEQQLVDCAQAFDNHGCNGGLPSHAFEYIKYNGGLDTEESYPYFGTDRTCVFNKATVGATVSGVQNITQSDESELVKAVGLVGPVSIAYEVSGAFRFYKKGVFSDPKCHSDPSHVNHAVLAVGYGTTETGVDYWIVKNSWGNTFGIDGYFWIKRGSNECGLAECASYPIV